MLDVTFIEATKLLMKTRFSFEKSLVKVIGSNFASERNLAKKIHTFGFHGYD